METEILKLDAPYEYIYCNGSIGLHIATMIVYEAGMNEDGEYELQTHSHPVVKYRNRPSGNVWNRAELTDCHVLCREDNKRISFEQFVNFANEARQLSKGHIDEDNLAMQANEIVGWKWALKLNGIEIEWPTIRKDDGKVMPQKVFETGLDIRQNPEGSKFKYTCKDMGPTDETSFRGGAWLPHNFVFNTKEDLKQILTEYQEMYYRNFDDHTFRIVYMWEEDSEFADILNEVNMHEPIIREEQDDIDV